MDKLTEDMFGYFEAQLDETERAANGVVSKISSMRVQLGHLRRAVEHATKDEG